jgi:predicted NUDIX family NTP pyrophosphohydrolase
MNKLSAGILLYRSQQESLEVLIAHPGGPFWSKKDLGAWSIPKGLVEPGEDLLNAAIREFREETGHTVSGRFIKLTPIKLRAGKIVIPFALEYDLDPEAVISNTFQTEWPPRSGQQQEFPEIDRVEWVNVDTAKRKLNPAQAAIIDELTRKLRIQARMA